ncbi:MAG: hypothetical protein WC551_08990 [Patescibacteria group bacterium]
MKDTYKATVEGFESPVSAAENPGTEPNELTNLAIKNALYNLVTAAKWTYTNGVVHRDFLRALQDAQSILAELEQSEPEAPRSTPEVQALVEWAIETAGEDYETLIKIEHQKQRDCEALVGRPLGESKELVDLQINAMTLRHRGQYITVLKEDYDVLKPFLPRNPERR